MLEYELEELMMQTIQIDNPEVESFIYAQYGNDQVGLINDFITFVKTELIVSDIKKGFDEIEQYESNKITITD
jgi:hypothetical protein